MRRAISFVYRFRFSRCFFVWLSISERDLAILVCFSAFLRILLLKFVCGTTTTGHSLSIFICGCLSPSDHGVEQHEADSFVDG